MKSKLLIFIAIFVMAAGCFVSCGGGDQTTKETETQLATQNAINNAAEIQLNITVFLDLSDRLLHGSIMPQTEIDTAIVNHIVELFVNDCVEKKIIGCKNSFQVLFYPTPSISSINTLAADLKLDLSKLPAAEKKNALIKFQETVPQNLGVIYQQVLANKSWIGCDIWDFFSSNRVDQYCIRKGYRNILVILTDGYLYHVNNKIKKGNEYSYILPQTLSDPNSSLIVKREGLTDIEVLFLEINPFQPDQRDKIVTVISNWLKAMGVPEGSYLINETDTPTNTEIIIDSFIN